MIILNPEVCDVVTVAEVIPCDALAGKEYVMGCGDRWLRASQLSGILPDSIRWMAQMFLHKKSHRYTTPEITSRQVTANYNT